ncbi:MAG: 50S ribosomal protein L10 [Candidatus Eisenbacteria bacterium]
MPLTRAQKETRLKELRKQLESKTSVLLGDFTGMDVATATEIRSRFREAKVEYRVVKNSLAKLAMDETGFSALTEHLTGPNGFVMTDGDAAAAAKIMVEFEKSRKTPQIRPGLIDSVIVTAAEIRRLAELPSREVLLAQIAAGFQAPVTGLARLLHELSRKLVATLDAVAKQKGATSGA